MTNEFSAGFSAFLKFMTVFLAGFIVLGYPVPVSIFFALFGGLAGGFMFAWLNSSDTPMTDEFLDLTNVDSSQPPMKKPSKYAKTKKNKKNP
jgi:hypothetical protein